MGAAEPLLRRSRRERNLAQETPVPTAGRIRVRGSRRRTGLYLGRRSQGEAGNRGRRGGHPGIALHTARPEPRPREHHGPARRRDSRRGHGEAGQGHGRREGGHQGRAWCAAGRDQARDSGPRGSRYWPITRSPTTASRFVSTRTRCTRLRALPGVIGVHFIPNHERDNAISVPYLGVPTVWSSPNFIRGLDRKIAIIDTRHRLHARELPGCGYRGDPG